MYEQTLIIIIYMVSKEESIVFIWLVIFIKKWTASFLMIKLLLA